MWGQTDIPHNVIDIALANRLNERAFFLALRRREQFTFQRNDDAVRFLVD